MRYTNLGWFMRYVLLVSFKHTYRASCEDRGLNSGLRFIDSKTCSMGKLISFVGLHRGGSYENQYLIKGPVKRNLHHKIPFMFLSISLNMCLGFGIE